MPKFGIGGYLKVCRIYFPTPYRTRAAAKNWPKTGKTAYAELTPRVHKQHHVHPKSCNFLRPVNAEHLRARRLQ